MLRKYFVVSFLFVVSLVSHAGHRSGLWCVNYHFLLEIQIKFVTKHRLKQEKDVFNVSDHQVFSALDDICLPVHFNCYPVWMKIKKIERLFRPLVVATDTFCCCIACVFVRKLVWTLFCMYVYVCVWQCVRFIFYITCTSRRRASILKINITSTK